MSGTQRSAPGAAQRQLQALSTAPSSQEPSGLGRGAVLGAGTLLQKRDYLATDEDSRTRQGTKLLQLDTGFKSLLDEMWWVAG